MSDERLYLLLDTNVFLHFRNLIEIDWRALAGGDATVVVPHRPTINELDRHKNESPRARIRERAATAIRKFKGLLAGNETLRDGTLFEMWTVNPKIVEGLDSSYPDDLLIASALHFAEQRNVHVALVTADGGVQIKAPQFGLRVVELPEELRLVDEPDEKEVELRRLKAEIAAKPTAKLTLTFAKGGSGLSVQVSRGHSKSDAVILAEAREQYQDDLAAELRRPDPGWVRSEVEHQKELRDVENLKRITFPVSLRLRNEGTAPADDIHTTLAIPDCFSASNTEPEPEHMREHRSALQRLEGAERYLTAGWRIDGNRAEFPLARLKQSKAEELPTLHLTLRDPEYRGEVTLACNVNAADPPIDSNVALSIKLDQTGRGLSLGPNRSKAGRSPERHRSPDQERPAARHHHAF